MFKLLLFVFITIFFSSSCSQKVKYVEKDKAGIKIPLITNQVVYKTYKSFDVKTPQCVAVLPFDVEKNFKLHKNVYLNPSAVVRRSVLSHLSPLSYRDIELVLIDKLFKELTNEGKIDYKYIGEQLNCDSVLTGTVTNFDSYDLKIYSNLIIGAKLKLYRTSDTALLWEGEHKAESKGGTIPLSPIGVAVGMINAARNMIEEQYLRLSDDLSRRLMKVFPYSANINFDETLIANLDKKRIQNSLSDPDKTKEPIRTKTERFDRIQEIRAQLNDENILLKDKISLYEELVRLEEDDIILLKQFTNDLLILGDYEKAYIIATKAAELNITRHGLDSETYYLLARAAIKLNELDIAEESLIKAIAFDNNDYLLYNALGFTYTKKTNTERAIASYQKAIQLNSENGFANYNLAVEYYNLGENENSILHFFEAANNYLKNGRYDKVLMVIDDLKGFQEDEIDIELNDKIKIFEEKIVDIYDLE